MTAALGMGTYRARGVPEAAEAAIRSGVYWIDTAPNYHHGKDEALLAPVLKTHRGVRLSTKVGFLSEPQQDEAVRRRVLTHSEAGQGHSLAPSTCDGRSPAARRPWAARPTSCSFTTPNTAAPPRYAWRTAS